MPTGSGGGGTPTQFPTSGGGGGTTGGGGTLSNLLAAILGAGGALGGAAIGSAGQRSASRTAAQVAQEELALRRQILALIAPFATQLIQLGMDPQQILSSPLGAALLQPGRTALTNEFGQARSNFIDSMAGAGFSPGSGVAAGPLANLFGMEAQAQAGLTQQLPLQAIGLGTQGAGLLQGLQPGVGGINQSLQIAGQPSLLSQAFANLPAAIAAAIAAYNQGRQQQQQPTIPAGSGGGGF